jgi:hypothetical protein
VTKFYAFFSENGHFDLPIIICAFAGRMQCCLILRVDVGAGIHSYCAAPYNAGRSSADAKQHTNRCFQTLAAALWEFGRYRSEVIIHLPDCAAGIFDVQQAAPVDRSAHWRIYSLVSTAFVQRCTQSSGAFSDCRQTAAPPVAKWWRTRVCWRWQ